MTDVHDMTNGELAAGIAVGASDRAELLLELLRRARERDADGAALQEQVDSLYEQRDELRAQVERLTEAAASVCIGYTFPELEAALRATTPATPPAEVASGAAGCSEPTRCKERDAEYVEQRPFTPEQTHEIERIVRRQLENARRYGIHE